MKKSDSHIQLRWHLGFTLHVLMPQNRSIKFLSRILIGVGYVTPATMLAGQEVEIWKERDRKLEMAREQRRLRRRGISYPHCSASGSAA